MLDEIYLGVLNIPYDYNDNSTTASVALLLEKKYGIMGKFIEIHNDEVQGHLKNALISNIQDVIEGNHPDNEAFYTAFSKIEHDLKKFISSREVERVGIPGVPTKAALKGVTHRLKQKRRGLKNNVKGQRRPSFVDTGLYESSLKVWGTFK